MSAIFKAPIAAIVFVLEVIMLDLTMSSLVPLLLSSVSAALMSFLFLGKDVIYEFNIETAFQMQEVPLYIFLGIFCGFISVYFTRVYVGIGNIFDKMKKRSTRLIVGGLALGILIYLFPSLYGEGYEVINGGLAGNLDYVFDNPVMEVFRGKPWTLIALVGLILFLKVIATSITFGAGGVGGIFAPSLFTGMSAGIFFALVHNQIFTTDISPINFALVGMGGIIAGVLHAPLTAIFLIAELTMAYELFFPLMITATISYATIKYFEPNSVYHIQLARRKQLFTHDKDKIVLKLMQVDKLIERNFDTVRLDATLGDLAHIIAKSRRNIYPVIDDDKHFVIDPLAAPVVLDVFNKYVDGFTAKEITEYLKSKGIKSALIKMLPLSLS